MSVLFIKTPPAKIPANDINDFLFMSGINLPCWQTSVPFQKHKYADVKQQDYSVLNETINQKDS